MNETLSTKDDAPKAERLAARVERLVGRLCSATLYLADCHDLLPIEADAVVSDPPYGMEWDTNHKRFTGGEGGQCRQQYPQIRGDNTEFDPTPWLAYKKVILFGFNHFARRLPIGTTLIWLKRYDTGFGTFLSDGEIAWMSGGHGVYAKRDVSLQDPTATRLHPTQKPVPLMEWCLEMAKIPEGATVLDPFMGSGTTGVACVQTGRNFIGVESEERYFDVAVERLRREMRQGRMF